MNNDYLVWLDIETTGLDPEKDFILEWACVITNTSLEEVNSYCETLSYPQSVLDAMGPWCRETHKLSGLTERVLKSGVSLDESEQHLYDFIGSYVKPGQAVLCGNSVHFDRMFLRRHMPNVEQFLHYRHIDVSTVKELARRWAPQVLHGVNKQNKHRALDDIRESIEELKHYERNFFK